MMKKILVLLLVLVVLASCSFTLTAFAEENKDTEAYDIYEKFAKDYRQRYPGSQGEKNSAFFIASKLAGYGYTSVDGESDTYAFLQNFNGKLVVRDSDTLEYHEENFVSQNVVAYKRSGKANAKLLVLGCAYGNAYDINNVKSESAYETSSAVATLLSVASKLKGDISLEFDLAFVFFGAEHVSFSGSQSFLSTNKQQILGYIDVDSIGGGDNLYIYYDDVSTAHGRLIDSLIAKFGFDVKGAPFNKNAYSTSSEVSRPYVHKGLDSANYFFMEKGIPSVRLFGYNWISFGESESASKKDIIGTEDDNFETMNEYYGENFISERLNLASDVIRTTVLKNGELADAFEKYDNGYTSLYSNGAYWGVIIGIVILIIVVFIIGAVFASKKTVSAGSADFSTNSSYLNGNEIDTGIQKEDDVFDFGSEPIVSDSKDVDTQENSSDKTDDDIFGEF